MDNTNVIQILVDMCFAACRWSIMTHVEEVQATGTACLGLNTWPQGVIWLQRWVRYVSSFYQALVSYED